MLKPIKMLINPLFPAEFLKILICLAVILVLIIGLQLILFLQADTKAFYNDFDILQQSLEDKFRQGLTEKSNLAGVYPCNFNVR